MFLFSLRVFSFISTSNDIMNELPVIGIPVFARRTLGSLEGKHCQSLEGNVWRKVVSRYKKTIFERDQRFFAVVFIANGFG